jgi:hypothetical protein
MTSQYLVRVGKWERVMAGYRYAEILPGNITDRVDNSARSTVRNHHASDSARSTTRLLMTGEARSIPTGTYAFVEEVRLRPGLLHRMLR